MSSLGAQEMMIAQWMQCWPTLQLEKVVKALSFAWERGTRCGATLVFLATAWERHNQKEGRHLPQNHCKACHLQF